VQRANARKAKLAGETMTDEEKRALMATEASLHANPESPRPQKTFSGIENFSIMGEEEEEKDESTLVDAESLFNLPKSKDDDEDDQPR